MKRLIIVLVLGLFSGLFPGVLAAQDLDIRSLEGEDWYGLYMGGQKCGYASHALKVDESGAVTSTEHMRFQLSMMGVKQDMETTSTRRYDANGELERIATDVIDVSGPKKFVGRIEGDELVLTSSVAGNTTEQRFPKPDETLEDALRQMELIAKDGAKVGDEISYSIFEPLYQREIEGTSRIAGIEERVLDGTTTKVFVIRSTMMGIETRSIVTEDGVTLEDVVGGMITMRLEPKEMAQDVDYNNDTVVSNAARLETPIPNARNRATLKLKLTGPLNDDHMFSDEGQTLETKDGFVEFTGKRVSLEGFDAAQLPIEDEELKEWTKPTVLVQSDDPKIIAKAEEIIGDERDSLKASELLSDWVFENMESGYSASLTNALEVLEQLEGDCTEHSILFVGLARAAGLPAREVAGLIYVEGPTAGFYFHQWAKVWVGKWIEVDPTFGQSVADATHIKLSEGNLYEQAKLLPVIGQIRVEVIDETG